MELLHTLPNIVTLSPRKLAPNQLTKTTTYAEGESQPMAITHIVPATLFPVQSRWGVNIAMEYGNRIYGSSYFESFGHACSRAQPLAWLTHSLWHGYHTASGMTNTQPLAWLTHQHKPISFIVLERTRGAGRSSEVERSLMVRWVVGSILHGVDPLSYFSFQPVLHDWCNKGRGMCYPVCGMVHIKEPLLLIDKSSLCGGSGFPFSLSEWSLTICLTPYYRR